MKKHSLLLLVILIGNGLLAGQKDALKVHVVRGINSNGLEITHADERVIAQVSNGIIGEKRTLSTKAAIKKRWFDNFRLPNPLLPLQKD